MERKSYITRRFNQILSETINEKANELMGKLKFNPPGTSFDYVQEGKDMCNECGKPYSVMGEMIEGETCECGDPYSIEVKERLIGGQRKLDKNKNNKIDAEDFKLLRKSKKEMREYTMGDDKLEVVKPYGDMSTDSPNIKPGKKNQVKNVGFDYQKKVAKKFDDYELQEGTIYELEVSENFLKRMFGRKEKEEVTPNQEKNYDSPINALGDYYDPTDWDHNTMMRRSDMEAMDNEFRKRKENPQPVKNQPREKTSSMSPEAEKMDKEYGPLAATLGMDPREVAMYYPNKKDETNETIYELELDETETDEGNAFTGMLKKTKKGDSFELDGKKYTDRSSLEEKWEGDVEVKQTGEYSDMSIEELNSAIKKLKAKTDKIKEDGKKVSHADRTKMSQLYFAKRAKQGWKGKGKAKVEETYYRIKVDGEMATFSENEMIDIIESIVKEEKTNIKTSKQPAGYAEYARVHKADGKEEEKYFKDLAKKMTDYIKDGSKQKKFDTNPTQFPKGNGELGEMDKKAYEIDQEGKDFNYEVGGLNIPDYDEVKPEKETIEKQIKGSSTNGNDQSYANAVNTGVNDKFAEYFENDQLAKWKDESYGRVPSPVYADNPSKSKGKGKTKLKEEFSRIQQLMGYNQKTQ
jgi:hypothetical protein